MFLFILNECTTSMFWIWVNVPNWLKFLTWLTVQIFCTQRQINWEFSMSSFKTDYCAVMCGTISSLDDMMTFVFVCVNFRLSSGGLHRAAGLRNLPSFFSRCWRTQKAMHSSRYWQCHGANVQIVESKVCCLFTWLAYGQTGVLPVPTGQSMGTHGNVTFISNSPRFTANKDRVIICIDRRWSVT